MHLYVIKMLKFYQKIYKKEFTSHQRKFKVFQMYSFFIIYTNKHMIIKLFRNIYTFLFNFIAVIKYKIIKRVKENLKLKNFLQWIILFYFCKKVKLILNKLIMQWFGKKEEKQIVTLGIFLKQFTCCGCCIIIH